LLGTKSHDLPHFEAISQTPLPQLPSVVQIGFAFLPSLPGWQRQSLYLPQHASEQAPRQVALCQQQPVVTGMLNQPSARLRHVRTRMNIDGCSDPMIQSYNSNRREYVCLEYVLYAHLRLISAAYEVITTRSR
jgi:hypothetical protein